MDGILLFNKPILWTSHDAVDFIRRKINQRSVGHAGTLDPLATGLLILLIGKFTKKMNEFMDLDKEYEAEVTFGIRTDSLDLEGRILEERQDFEVKESALLDALKVMQGEQLQKPPRFSALKKNGAKLYQLARQGLKVEVEPRRIVIHELELLHYDFPRVYLRMSCSKGTYIRSLAEELGKRLGSGAVLSGLLRTRIGTFKLKSALTDEAIDELSIDDFHEKLKQN